MRTHLTKRALDALESLNGRELIVWDEGLRRFGVRIKPSGVKSFVIQYRNTHGRSRRKSIGQYPPLTLQRARAIAQRELSRVAAGADPVADNRQSRTTPTVRELAASYLSDHVEVRSKKSTRREAETALNKHIVPMLGSVPITDISRADISRLHRRMKKTPVLANRVLKVARAMFAFAVREEFLASETDNPACGVEKYKERKRERHLSLAEYEALGKALDDLISSSTISRVAGTAIRLLALTGLRVGETLSLSWDDVRLPEGKVYLRETKTDPRSVVINTAAQQVLAELASYTGAGKWVFPGRVHGQHLVNISKPWGLVRDRAGISDVRLHDLRHSFASVGVASQLGLPVIGALLGHRQPSTTARYAHLADDPLRKATDGIGSTIDAALRGRPDATVRSLSRGDSERPREANKR